MYTLALCLTLLAPAPKKEAPSILGTWIIDKVIVIGKEEAQPDSQRLTFTADGQLIAKDEKGTEKGVAKYKVDVEKSPCHLDMTPGIAGSDKPAEGIFKIEGDVLTICYSFKGRPKDFTSDFQNTNIVITHKRAKKP